jgi:hypothetical protein
VTSRQTVSKLSAGSSRALYGITLVAEQRPLDADVPQLDGCVQHATTSYNRFAMILQHPQRRDPDHRGQVERPERRGDAAPKTQVRLADLEQERLRSSGS